MNDLEKISAMESQSESPGLADLNKLKHDRETKQDLFKMTLALWVLAGIFIILLIAIICSFCPHSNCNMTLFEIWKTGLLPIVTLILGYYFSKM